MEARRVQPRRAAQDPYTQSRAVSQEPLAAEPGAREACNLPQPDSTPTPSDSQALSPRNNERAVGAGPERTSPAEQGEDLEASSPPVAGHQLPPYQQTPTHSGNSWPISPPEASAMSPAAEQRMVSQILMAYGLPGVWVVGNRRLKFHAMKFHEIS